MTDFERAAFVDPVVATAPAHVSYEPTPILAENVGPREEVAQAPKKKKASVPKPAATDKGKGKEIDAPKKKKHVPLIRPKRVVIGSPIVPEEGLGFGNDGYTSLSGGVPRTERTEEDELALALKASMVTALEEQAARAATVLFEDFSGSFTNP